ncbi:gliding motility-associated C-terminal domain-containing protein [Pontibacter locisalis]|uniref:Gliding motility-associated C-terminal domain-containing protein n=1 Tax=Pontibacter locisalis TaxID=1719035 RepID=A0ABW5IGY2_9BACT
MLKVLLNIFFTLITCSVFAQGGTPCFKAYSSNGQEISTFCVDQEITFQDCGNTVPDEQEYYVFDYKSGTAIPTNLTTEKKHIFRTPGRYRVLHIGNYGGTTLTDTVSRVFEVKASPNPEFTVTPCTGNTVSVEISDTNYDKYIVDFGDGSLPATLQPSSEYQYKYNNGGTFTITVMGQYSGISCNNVSQKQTTLLPSPPTPRIQSLTVLQQAASGEIQLALQQLQPGFGYVIEEGDVRSGYQPVATIENISQAALTYSLKSINTETGKLYRVRPKDACNSNIPVFSNFLSSIKLAATSGNEEAILNWSTPSNIYKSFELYKDGALLQTLPGLMSGYIDSGLSCGEMPIYTIKGIAENGGISTSVTQRVQITSSIKPTAPYLLTSFDSDNQIILSVSLLQGKQAQRIELEKSIDGTPYKPLATVQQPTYKDANPELKPVCYRTTYTDPCNNTSAFSNVSCPIILKAEKLEDGAVKLDWSGYAGFPNGVKHYVVELLDDNGNVVQSYQVSGTSYTDRNLSEELQLLRYRIRATSNSGSEETYSNTVELEQEVQLHVPSAFTPNSDGLNDTFEVKGKLFSNFSIRIYNSLGNVVYQSTDAGAGWDGTYKGEKLPVGAYAYEITVKTSFGATKRRTGTVTLIR